MNRSLCVKSNNFLSEIFTPSSGVPQGYVSGPLLFVIYINDLVSNLKYANCLMYADNVKIFMRISSDSGAALLQNDLNHLYYSSRDLCLEYSMDKCMVLSFYRTT